MATSILTHHTYKLSDSDRLAITSKSDNTAGHAGLITQKMHAETEKKRLAHISKFGHQFG